MKRSVYAFAVAVALIAGLGSNAIAANNRGDHQSACGAAHGAFADENGNFGFLGGLGGTPGYHGGATGQEAGATGHNNSHTNCQDN
jgi:hypothetical protein